jgi:hypothetical protein
MVVARHMLNKDSNKQVSVRLFDTTLSMDVSRLTERKSGMKHLSMACAIGAVLCVSSTAFAQDNPPSSTTGLQAGDNVQSQNQTSGTTGTTHHKTMKHKSSTSMGKSDTPGMGTATPSGPAAPVTASGSGS